MSGWGKRCLADEELRMLYSHSWWKRCEQIITKTAGRAWVRVCRQASTLCTDPGANGDAALAGSWLVWLKNRWCVVGLLSARLATDAPFCRRGREHAAARRADGSGPAVTDECSHRGVGITMPVRIAAVKTRASGGSLARGPGGSGDPRRSGNITWAWLQSTAHWLAAAPRNSQLAVPLCCGWPGESALGAE